VQPAIPGPEVQARISRLEKEVASLKALLQFRDEELASQDSIISKERSTVARLKKEVLEANENYNQSVEGLSNELDRADQLESWLRAVQNECSEACKNAQAAEAEKGKLEAEVERLEAEKAKALKA
jgi:chromosome segregation ATPase